MFAAAFARKITDQLGPTVTNQSLKRSVLLTKNAIFVEKEKSNKKVWLCAPG